MQPNKEQWRQITIALDSLGYRALFNCDGYAVSAQLARLKNRLVIEVYVDGYVRGIWFWYGNEDQLDERCDIARRFFGLRKKALPTKTQALNIAIYGKQQCIDKRINQPSYYTETVFKTAKAFISHLKKHNAAIQILHREQYDALVINNVGIESEKSISG